jgi:hypothetical protein
MQIFKNDVVFERIKSFSMKFQKMRFRDETTFQKKSFYSYFNNSFIFAFFEFV